MNMKRLLLAIVAVFAMIFATDFMIHGVWLKPEYTASQSLWRGEAEMQKLIPLMTAAQLLASSVVVIVWGMGLAKCGCLKTACQYGLLMGLFGQVNTLIMYVVMPLPLSIAIQWFAFGIAQGVLVGVVTFFAYGKPASKVS